MPDTEREIVTDVGVHLIAAISLLEEYHRRLPPGKRDGLFNTKISDYKKAAERARTYMQAQT